MVYKKIISVVLLCFLSNGRLMASWLPTKFDMPSIQNYLGENQKYVFGAVALGMVSIPVYSYFKKLKNERRIVALLHDQLLADHKNRTIELIGNNQAFKKFVEKYSPPVKDLVGLIENERKIYDGYGTGSERFFAKKGQLSRGLSRIINAERIRNYIKKRGYKYIDVPHKYIFLVGNEWYVIAEKVKTAAQWPRVSLEQIKELADVVAEMGFADFNEPNLVFTDKDKFTFWDIEDASFAFTSGKSFCLDKYHNLVRLGNYIGTDVLTQEALSWLEEKAKEFEEAYKQQPDLLCHKIFSRTDLDDPEIDIDGVKDYARNFDETSHSTDYFKEKDEQAKAGWFRSFYR